MTWKRLTLIGLGLSLLTLTLGCEAGNTGRQPTPSIPPTEVLREYHEAVRNSDVSTFKQFVT